MKSSDYLELAAQWIERGITPWVCNALESISDKGTSDIRKRIRKSLWPHGTVATWLLENKHITKTMLLTGGNLIAYRAAWCRWMAEGYRAKGD